MENQGKLQVRALSGRSRRHRNRVDIIHDILCSVKKDEIQTHIMQKANLSLDMFRSYLSFLLEGGLIEKLSEREKRTARTNGSKVVSIVIYKITPKGESFLEAYEKLESIAVLA